MSERDSKKIVKISIKYGNEWSLNPTRKRRQWQYNRPIFKHIENKHFVK